MSNAMRKIKERNGTLDETLVGVDGNAFAILAHFQKHARRQGWSKGDIKAVMEEAQSRDYDHLVATISTFTEG